MRVWRILKDLEGLEDTMSALYDCLRLRYCEDPEAAALFARLRDDKISLRNAIRCERQAMFQSLENYHDFQGYDPEALDRLLRAAEDLISRAAVLSLAEALRCTAALERAGKRHHLENAVSRTIPSLGALNRDLGGADRDHVARLGLFAGARGISLQVPQQQQRTRA